MSLKVVLAIGVDSSVLEIQSSVWKSSGYIVTFARSIKDAITQFRCSDFDLVLLGNSLPADSRERLIFLIRAGGSRVPVFFIADSAGVCDGFADATVEAGAKNILEEIEALMASRARVPASRSTMSYSTTWRAIAR